MKNIFLITYLFFIYGCGYSSVYKNLENNNFQMTITEMRGDREMNNLIKNEINLHSNKNSINKYDIILITKYNKLTLAKDSSGTITDYRLSFNSTFLISYKEISRQIKFNESFKIKKQKDTIEQNSYERNIKRNFAASIRKKLITEIINFK